jgi:hypothetical protein
MMQTPGRGTHRFSRLLFALFLVTLPFAVSLHAQTDASLGVSMEVSVETQGDGSFTLTYTIHTMNLGTSDLHEVRLEDDLASAFSEAAAFEVVSVASQQGTVRVDYDGREARSLLSGADNLAVGEAIDVTLVVLVAVGDMPLIFANSALSSALAPDDSLVTDISEQGPEPDPDKDTDPSNNDAPTVITLDPRPVIGLAKAASVARLDDDEFSVAYTFAVRNLGQVGLTAVDVQDSLLLAFPEPAIVRVSTLSSTDLDVNSRYDGVNDVRLLSGTDVLLPGESGVILLSLTVSPNGGRTWFKNRAMARGNGPIGTSVMDFSQEGTEPDPDKDGDPTQHETPTGVLLARVSTSGSFETTFQIVDTPLTVDVTSIVFDSSLQIDDFSARLNARLTDTSFDLLTLSASGTLGTSQLSSSLVLNPTTLSFVSWQTSGSLNVLGARLTDTVYIASSQPSSYTLLRATGETGDFAFDASAKFGVCPLAFWEASFCADWSWALCATPLQACLGFDGQTGFESFTVTATGIPILESVLGGAGLLDVAIEFTPTEKVLTPTLRFEPQWFVCPEFRLFGGIDFSGSGGVGGISIYGFKIECPIPIGDLIFRVADSLDDSRNASITGKADFFELFEIEGPFPSCCASPGRLKVSAYFERPPAPSGALFGVGLLSGSVDFRVADHVAAFFSAEFTPVAPHWLFVTRLRISW